MSDFPAIGPDGSVVGKRSAPKRPSPESEGRQSNAAFDAILGGFAPDRSQASQNDEEKHRASENHARLQEAALAPARAGERGSASEAVHVPDQMLSTLFDDAQAGERRLPELGKHAVGVVLPQLAASPGSVTEIDVADDHAALAPAIAHHFAAMLGGTPPRLEKTAPAMTEQRATWETGPVTSRMAGPEVAVAADRARLGQPGRPELPSFRITRHETHFGPAYSFPDSRSETERHLKGEVRSGRKGAGAISGSRMGVPGAGNMRTPAGLVRSMGQAAEHVSRNGTMAGKMPGLANAAGLLTADMPPGAVMRDVVAGFRVERAGPLLQSEMAQAAGPLRVLHIQLQPAELGRIELRLRTTEHGLELHVEASRRETHALLQQDRDLIANILRKIGHPVEMVTISIGERASETASNVGAQGADGRLGAAFGEDRNGAGRFSQGQASPMAASPEASEAENDQDPPALAVRHRDSLYL